MSEYMIKPDVNNAIDEENYPGNKKDQVVFNGDPLDREEVIREYGIDPDNHPNSATVAPYVALYEVNITADNGTVETDDGKNIQAYPYGKKLVLTATPAEGYDFDEWQQDAGGSNAELELIVTEDLDVTAAFVAE